MTDTVDLSQERAEIRPEKKSLLGRFAAQYSNIALPFEVVLPDGAVQRFGLGTPTFRLAIRNKAGLGAVASLDEGRIGTAYLAGDIDLDGDMMKPFELRGSMKDFHLAHRGLAFSPADAVRAGAHQQDGDRLALRHSGGVLPQLPRSQDALLHAGRL